MIKKSLIFAVLATFCLATVLFTVVPVGSYGTYDPWLDSPSEDGKIDVRDVAPVAAAYGSTGDPTKNVNVTNFPLDAQGNLKVNVIPNSPLSHTFFDNSAIPAGTETVTPGLNTIGYKEFNLHIVVTPAQPYTLQVASECNGIWATAHSEQLMGGFGNTAVWTLKVTGEWMGLRVHNLGSATIYISAAVYLVP
jgi:hypothetical protein